MKAAIALISLAVLFLMSVEAQVHRVPHFKAMEKSACAIPSWQGDDYCDDINNNAGCNWDGGDCCAPHTPRWNDYCQVSFKHKLYPSASSLFNSELIFQVSLSFFLS